MSHLDQPALVSFRGDDFDQVIQDNRLMHSGVLAYAKQLGNANVKVYVTPRECRTDIAEWSMSISSVAGRQTYRVIQRSPTGSVSFHPG